MSSLHIDFSDSWTKRSKTCIRHVVGYFLNSILSQYIRGSKVSQYTDPDRALHETKGLITNKDYVHTKCIYFQRFPAQFDYIKEIIQKKRQYMSMGSYKPVTYYSDIFKKTMNKEGRYSDDVSLLRYLAPFSSKVHHISQTMIIKEGKNSLLMCERTICKRPEISSQSISQINTPEFSIRRRALHTIYKA